MAVWLAQNKNMFVYAVDLRLGPLKRAYKNVVEFDVVNKVKIIQSNGLTEINGDGIEEVVIAGLGGDQIKKIVSSCGWLKNFNVKMVVQPQSFVDQLRSFFYSNGFEIEKEIAVVDRKKIYVIMRIGFSGVCKKISLRQEVLGKLQFNSDKATLAYFKFQQQKKIKILKKLKLSKHSS